MKCLADIFLPINLEEEYVIISLKISKSLSNGETFFSLNFLRMKQVFFCNSEISYKYKT